MVDLQDQLVGFYEIAFIHVQFGDIAVNTGENIDHLVGRNVGRIGQANIQVLLQWPDGGYGDNARLLLIDLRAAAQAKDHERRDSEEDDDAECNDGVLLDRIHEVLLRAIEPFGSFTSPVKKRST